MSIFSFFSKKKKSKNTIFMSQILLWQIVNGRKKIKNTYKSDSQPLSLTLQNCNKSCDKKLYPYQNCTQTYHNVHNQALLGCFNYSVQCTGYDTGTHVLKS